MKIFLLDDSDALGCYIVELNKNNTEGNRQADVNEEKQVQSIPDKNSKYKSPSELKKELEELRETIIQNKKNGTDKNNPKFNVYVLNPECFKQAQNIDDFFNSLSTGKVWRLIGDNDNNKTSKLKSLANDGTDNLFLINVNLKTRPSTHRQDQEGVELLKHIRLTKELGVIHNLHVVLYSFEEQLELLKRKTNNLIMLSEGVSFHRLPDCLPEWTVEKLSELAKKPANVSDKSFQRYVQCDYQPPDSAHQFSNWWGLLQIFNARKGLDFTEIPRPQILDDNLVKLDNKKVLFLNGREEVTKNNTDIEKNLTALCKSIPQSASIIYIDDEKEWGESLSTALVKDLMKFSGSEKTVNVKRFHPEMGVFSGDNTLKDWIGKEIPESTDASMILLDLRLLGTKETNVPVEETSGAKIAKILRESHPGLPIILITASNKAYTFEAAMRLGIDGYWMKEGVGEHSTQVGSPKNYINLLELIAKVLGSEYQFLMRFSKWVTAIPRYENHNLWWHKPTWKYEEPKELDLPTRTTIHYTLNSIVILLKEYLHLFVLNYGFKGEDSTIERSWINALILESFKIIEAVHRIEAGVEYSTEDLLGNTRRDDTWGRVLRNQRKYAAHNVRARLPIKFVHAQSMLTGVITWLIVDQNNRRNPLESSDIYKELNGSDLFQEIQGSTPRH